MAKARGRPVLTPAQVRNCLRSTGSPQRDAPGRPATQRIGNRPDVRAFATCAFGKGKELAKEVAKEFKEGKETKEFVKEKELKELKDKDTKELKEKDFVKETKEKDKDKDLVENKLRDNVIGIRPTDAGTGAGTEQRLAALEQTVQQLAHFIGAELRPDLTQSALQGSSQAAKDEKDMKDAEKLSDA
jgi:hypothetical protein